MVLLILKCNLKYIEKKKNINNTLKKKEKKRSFMPIEHMGKWELFCF